MYESMYVCVYVHEHMHTDVFYACRYIDMQADIYVCI